jgi:DNA-binding transcriptional LysR family regulator
MSLSRAVKLQQIQCVVAAARQGSFRRAALALNVQQSSVSRNVQELEAYLGAPLFTRGAGGVALTEVGARFLADAELALVQLSRAAHVAAGVGADERNTVRIGAAAIPGSGPLPELLQAFTRTWPKHRFALHEACSADTLVALHAGALDLAIVLAAPRGGLGAEVWPLWRETLHLAVAARASAGSGSALSLREVGADGLILPSGEIGDLIAARLAAALGADFLGATCRASPETVLRLVAMGQGRAIVPAGALGLAPAGVAFRPIADAALPVSAVWLARNDKPSLRRLITLVRAGALPIGGGALVAAQAVAGPAAAPPRLRLVGADAVLEADRRTLIGPHGRAGSARRLSPV